MEEAESSGKKAEEVIASVWELFMHSRDHTEAWERPPQGVVHQSWSEGKDNLLCDGRQRFGH